MPHKSLTKISRRCKFVLSHVTNAQSLPGLSYERDIVTQYH